MKAYRVIVLLAFSASSIASAQTTAPATSPATRPTRPPRVITSKIGDSPAILKAEFIFETAPFPSCHAATIAQTSDGGLVAAWFGGSAERATDVGIWVSRKDDDKWSAPLEAANGVMDDGTPRASTFNPVLFQVPKGPLILFYKKGPRPNAWWGMMKTSDDGGKTWSAEQKLPDKILGPIKNKPILLKDGTLLCGSSVEGGGTTLHMEYTPDFGKTWTISQPITNPTHSLIQPTLLDHGDGVIQYLCRSKSFIYEGWSTDSGKTWSEEKPTALPCPGTGLDAVQLKDGRTLLAFDNSPTERNPLSVVISKDGTSWGTPIIIERSDDNSQMSYPAVIQTDDGNVHIAYTWARRKMRHVVLDPSRIP